MIMKTYNCKTCLYANENCGVDCDKRLLLDGKMVHIEPDKVELDCPSHSDYKVEETRYDRPWTYLHEADDVCSICGRPLRMSDENTYESIGHVIRCSICKEKGR